MDWSLDAQVAPKKKANPLGIGLFSIFSIRLTFEPGSTKIQREFTDRCSARAAEPDRRPCW
jgi:hypothetical protein